MDAAITFHGSAKPPDLLVGVSIYASSGRSARLQTPRSERTQRTEVDTDCSIGSHANPLPASTRFEQPSSASKSCLNSALDVRRSAFDVFCCMQKAAAAPDNHGHFGPYGGMFVPETLVSALNELSSEYDRARQDPDFQQQLDALLRDFAGRPTRSGHERRAKVSGCDRGTGWKRYAGPALGGS